MNGCFRKCIANIFNIFFKDCCFIMLLTISHSLFLGSILSIIFVCTKKKMVRIYTRWVVAMMKHAEPFWDWTFMDFIRESMCQNSFICAHILKLPISKFGASTCPSPARFCLFNKIIESFSLVAAFLRRVATSGARHRAIKPFAHIDRRFSSHERLPTFFTACWYTGIFSHNDHCNEQIILCQPLK